MNQHLVTTVAGETRCRCRTMVLTGWAEGLHARVEATPTDAAGELRALLAGLWTYDRMRTGELVYRGAHRIRAHPAGEVYVEHRCSRLASQPALFPKTARTA